MPTLREPAKVAELCQIMAESLMVNLDQAYELSKKQEELRFSSAWDGIFEHTAMVDLVLHSYSWTLLRSITAAELKELLIADCIRALQTREEMQDKLKKGLH